MFIKLLTPNDPYMGRTTPRTSKRCILYIYSTNIGTEYFKHALYSPFCFLQNAVCFIMLTCLVPVLFTFYIQCMLKLKKNNSAAKGLRNRFNSTSACFFFYLQHVPLQIVILHAWKDHRTRFTLYMFPSYFRLIPMAVCVLFVFLDL